MEYENAEDMARALVRSHASASHIRSLVMAKFGECPSTKRIAAWRSHFITSDPGYKRTSHNAKPIPDDFRQIAPTMTKAQLRAHYDVHWSGTIDRWLAEAGVTARKFIPRANRLSLMGRPKAAMELKRQKTDYEIAADVLRRERFPVNRCNEDGSYNLTGKYWRVGRNIYTPEELIQKARRYG